MQPSAKSMAEFRAAALALKAAPKEVRSRINKAVRAEGNVIWREEIDRAARSNLDRRIIAKGARIQAGNPARAIAANSKRALSGGLVPMYDFHGFEYGSSKQEEFFEYERRSPRGKFHSVKRRTKRQLPERAPVGSGRVAFKAWHRTGPRLVSLWTQIIYRSVYEAFGE